MFVLGKISLILSAFVIVIGAENLVGPEKAVTIDGQRLSKVFPIVAVDTFNSDIDVESDLNKLADKSADFIIPRSLTKRFN